MDSPAISQIHTLCLQMERHLSTPFPFSLWAKHCHYSPYHLRHLFTETIGGRAATGLLLTTALGDRFLSRVRKSTGFLRRLPASLPYVPGPFPGQGLLLSPPAFPGRTISLDLRSKGRGSPPSRHPSRHS